MDVTNTLKERGTRYGEFHTQAEYAQSMKRIFQSSPNWEKMTDDQREALDMFANKIGRILNGDPNYADSWHDIAGYAQLVENRLNAKEEVRKYNEEVDRYLEESLKAGHRLQTGYMPTLYPEDTSFSYTSDSAMAGVERSEVLGIHPVWPEGEMDTVAAQVRRHGSSQTEV